MKQKFMALFNWSRIVVKGFLDKNASMHAAGLTYFSMLAIVPILCVLLLAAKTFNVDDYVRSEINTHLDSMIASVENGQDDDLAQVTGGDEDAKEKKKIAAQEFGRQAREISDKLFERIDEFNVGTLGMVGFVFLLWTVISSVGMVEVSFNEIWEVQKARPIWKRAFLYLAVVTVIPVLAALAMSMPILNVARKVIVATLGATWLTQWVSDGLLWFLGSWFFTMLITLTFASLAFMFIFKMMPHCPVSTKASFYGGVMTAVIFAAWIKICAVAQVGIAKSSALYGSFAFLPIVLAWLYMSWQIVLLGANMVNAFEKSWKVEKSES